MPSSSQHGDRLHGERFVQLEQIDVRRDPSRPSRRRGARLRPASSARTSARRPLVAWPTMRASGARPSDFAPRRRPSRPAPTAPSLTPRRVAGGDRAVLLERRLQRGERLDGRVGADRLVAIDDDRRRPSSAGSRSAGSRRRTRPSRVARAALLMALARRTSSCARAADAGSARRRPRRQLPMWHCSNAHHRPSLIIESTTSPLPMRSPSRTRGSRYGQLLIDSMPPATATSMSPTRDALIGEHHRLQAGAADLVDRQRGDVVGQAAVERRLARRVLAEAGRRRRCP